MADTTISSLPLGVGYEQLLPRQRGLLLEVLGRLTLASWSDELIRQWVGSRRLVVVRSGSGDSVRDQVWGRVGGAYRQLVEVTRTALTWRVARGPRSWEVAADQVEAVPGGYWGLGGVGEL